MSLCTQPGYRWQRNIPYGQSSAKLPILMSSCHFWKHLLVFSLLRIEIPKHFETQSLQLKCPKNIHRLAVWLEKIIKSSHQIARDFVDTFSADTDTDTADPRSSRGHSNTIVCRLLPEMFPPQPNCINNQLSKYLPSTDPLFCNLFFL